MTTRPPARVTSIDLLRDWQAALGTFRVELLDALAGAALDVRRTMEWRDDRQSHWLKAIRDRHDEVTHAKAELARKQWVLRGERQPDVTEEVKALRRAQARLAEAEDKAAHCRRWAPALQKAVEEFEGPMRRLADLADGELPQAAALIERLICDLEAYLALTPAARPPTAAVAPRSPGDSQ